MSGARTRECLEILICPSTKWSSCSQLTVPDNQTSLLPSTPCSAPTKKKESKEVSFSTSTSVLPIATTGAAHELKFAFRTASHQGTIMSQTISESTDEFYGISMDIIEDSSVSFNIAAEGQSHAEYIMKTDHQLADGEWHFVRIDYLLGKTNQARFTVDSDELVVDLPTREAFLQGTIYAGGVHQKYQDTKTGFIGCMKDIEYGGRIMNFEVTADMEGVREGCESSCFPDLCANDATCVERWGTYECICANPVTQGGQHCETSLNDDAITFLTVDAYSQTIIKNLTTIEQTKDILKEDIVIAFRTSNREGLILYVNDHNNNFIQLSLEPAENEMDKVIFTYNSGHDIIEVFVEGTDFATGKLIQIEVQRTPDVTYLTVDGVTSQVEAPLNFLESYNYIPFPDYEEKERVIPGRAPSHPADFTQLFIGGVDKNTQSTIAGFIGCLSGFVYGKDTIINLSTIAKEDEDPDILEGCAAKCIDSPCKNNGKCIEDFSKQMFVCDCSETFFIGETCTNDIGAHFNGNGALSYRVEEETESGGINGIKIRAAFSTDKLPESEALVTLYTAAEPSEDYILATMTADGYINFQIFQESVLYSGLSNINAADVYRHSLYLSAQKNTTPVAEVDGDSVVFMKTEKPVENVRLSYQMPDLAAIPEDGDEVTAMDDVQFQGDDAEKHHLEENTLVDEEMLTEGELQDTLVGEEPLADEEILTEEEPLPEEEPVPEQDSIIEEETPDEAGSLSQEEPLAEGESLTEVEPFNKEEEPIEEETPVEEDALVDDEPPAEIKLPAESESITAEEPEAEVEPQVEDEPSIDDEPTIEKEPSTEEEQLTEEELTKEAETLPEEPVSEDESTEGEQDDGNVENTEMNSRKKRNVQEENQMLSNTFHLAGSWSDDARFVHLEMYKGCISNAAILIKDKLVRPEDSYFGYTQDEDIEVVANDETAITEGACSVEWAPPVVIAPVKPNYQRMIGSAWEAEGIKKLPFQRAAIDTDSGTGVNQDSSSSSSADENSEDDEDEKEEESKEKDVLLIMGIIVLVSIIIAGACFIWMLLKVRNNNDNENDEKDKEDVEKDPSSAQPLFSGNLAREASEDNEPSFAGADSTPGKYKQKKDGDEPKETAPLLSRPKSQEIPTKTEPNHEPLISRPLSQEVFNTPPPSPTYGMLTSAPLGTISEVTLSQWPQDRRESVMKEANEPVFPSKYPPIQDL